MYKEFLSLGTGLGKIRSKLAALVAVAVILSPFAAAYAASSAYSFTMSNRVVDGCAQGLYHTLAAGGAYLSGSTSAGGSTIPVSYELERDVFGPNPSYGSVNGGINTSFSNLAFSSVPADTNFCLVISRGSTDAWTVTGSGTLHN